jgi:hypothetical protein
MLAIDAHGLSFRDGPDGKKQVNLDVVARPTEPVTK